MAHPWVKEDDEEDEESEADESDLVTGVSMSRNELSSSAVSGAVQNTEDTRANINVINVDNIFCDERGDKYRTKLSYDDY